jgi:DNA repair protein RadC
MGRYRITDLDREDRPRERLASVGASALSNAELIGILFGSGIPGQNAVQLSQSLLIDLGGMVNLPKVSFKELHQRRGIGQAKAVKLIAAIE